MDSPKELRRQLIGEILVEMGYTDLSSINEARRIQMDHSERRLGEVLVEMGRIKPEQLSAALVRQSQSQAPRPEFR
jgi:hypothetical protein